MSDPGTACQVLRPWRGEEHRDGERTFCRWGILRIPPAGTTGGCRVDPFRVAMFVRFLLALFVGVTLAAPWPLRAQQGARAAQPAAGVVPPQHDYLAFVVSESNDRVQMIRFGRGGARVERSFQTGIMITDTDGPHGVAVAPDGKHYYVTTGHGSPFGRLWKYTTERDELVTSLELGHFPASLQVSPDGMFVFVVNFNLYGDMVPSSVSVVDAEAMVEVARVRTCTMPHGSRLDPAGRRQYSTCMMDDMLVEIDANNLEVARHFMLAAGREHGMAGAPGAHGQGHAHGAHGQGHAHGAHGDHAAPPAAAGTGDHTGHGARTGVTRMAHDVSCSPTWAQPSADGARVFVACNKSNDIVEVDVERWTMTRRIPAGPGVYNLAVTRDGSRLIATNKAGQSVSVFELPSGRELARIPTQRKVVHGVAVTPDDRYAFITVEGIGAEPGTVEVIDLRALRVVARVDVGQQAGGVDVWKMVEPAPGR
jgi:DNA-binding beta-propeller fold protein YncE